MNITPHLGIGDLLSIKMIQISHNLDIHNININKDILLKYCENYEEKIKFITQFIEFLFPNTKYCINNNTIDFNSFKLIQINDINENKYDNSKYDNTLNKIDYSKLLTSHAFKYFGCCLIATKNPVDFIKKHFS